MLPTPALDQDDYSWVIFYTLKQLTFSRGSLCSSKYWHEPIKQTASMNFEQIKLTKSSEINNYKYIFGFLVCQQCRLLIMCLTSVDYFSCSKGPMHAFAWRPNFTQETWWQILSFQKIQVPCVAFSKKLPCWYKARVRNYFRPRATVYPYMCLAGQISTIGTD